MLRCGASRNRSLCIPAGVWVILGTCSLPGSCLGQFPKESLCSHIFQPPSVYSVLSLHCPDLAVSYVCGKVFSAEKRREVKGKGEKQRYTHPNAELQRTARRGKSAFLKEQCKEIEENKRMGKTRDLFKKTRDTRDMSCKDAHSKCGNGVDLT